MSNPRITMLGPSNCGKTCYLVAMYNIMEQGFHGVTVSTPDLSQGLRLNAHYDKMLEEKGQERYPKGTAVEHNTIINYTFSLNYAFKSVFAFDWYDYRGGVMKDASAPEERNDLIKMLKDSFGIIFCYSGDFLIKHSQRQLTQKEVTEINKIKTTFSAVSNEFIQYPKITIIVPKADYIIGWSETKLLNELRVVIPEVFCEGVNIDVSIIRCSLGSSLANDEGNAIIDPWGVHYPILDMAVRWYEERIKIIQQSKDRLGQAIDDAIKGQTLWEDWFGRSNERQFDIDGKLKLIAEAEQDIVKKKEMITPISNEINERYFRYIDGRKVMKKRNENT